MFALSVTPWFSHLTYRAPRYFAFGHRFIPSVYLLFIRANRHIAGGHTEKSKLHEALVDDGYPLVIEPDKAALEELSAELGGKVTIAVSNFPMNNRSGNGFIPARAPLSVWLEEMKIPPVTEAGK